jgi:serine/threonine protein kinase
MNTIKIPPNKNHGEISFEILEKLGEGTFGQVFKIRPLEKLSENFPDSQLFALKVISLSNKTENIENEINVINYLNEKYPQCTDYLLCYYDISKDDKNLYLISDLMDYDLYTFYYNTIINLKDKTRFNVMYVILSSILTALAKLEEIGLVHRDVKIDNILVKELGDKKFFVVLADFGFTCSPNMMTNKCSKFGATLSYLDPEYLLEFLDNPSAINNKSYYDTYALAITLYQMLVNQVYLDDLFDEQLRNILSENKQDSTQDQKAENKKKLIQLYEEMYEINLELMIPYYDFVSELLQQNPNDQNYNNFYKLLNFISENLKPFRTMKVTPIKALQKLSSNSF